MVELIGYSRSNPLISHEFVHFLICNHESIDLDDLKKTLYWNGLTIQMNGFFDKWGSFFRIERCYLEGHEVKHSTIVDIPTVFQMSEHIQETIYRLATFQI